MDLKSPTAASSATSPRPVAATPSNAAANAAANAGAGAAAAAAPTPVQPLYPNAAAVVGVPFAAVPNALLSASLAPPAASSASTGAAAGGSAGPVLGLDVEEPSDAAGGGAAGGGGGAGGANSNNNNNSEYVCLVSKEGHRFIVSREAALASGTIRTILLGPGQWKEKSEPMTTVVFEAISTPILEKVIQYFYYKKQYDGTTAPLPPFKLEMDSVVPLLLAANFLDT